MVALRRKGINLKEIGRRFGFSERTVRRYVGNIEPALLVPQPNEQHELEPRVIRRQILRHITDELLRDNQLAGLDLTLFDDTAEHTARLDGPPPMRFLNEAESLLRRALASCGDDTVRLIASSTEAQQMFVTETISALQADYRRWVFIMHHYYGGGTGGWSPPSGRILEDITKLSKYDWLYRTILQIADERR